MPPERISKVLAAARVASRRGSDDLVSSGRVTVDGRPAVLGERVDPAEQVVAVDGRRIGVSSAPAIHLVVNKPIGVTSTVRDRHADSTVIDLVPRDLGRGARLYPVGRLDRDSEGLLLLTDDGAWAETVLHPRYGVEREYAIAVAHALRDDQLDALARGIRLEEGTAVLGEPRPQTRTETKRLEELLDPAPDPRLHWYRGTLRQGWKRQVRRMFGAVGAPVRRLVRVRIGPLRLEDLATGEVRALTAAEVRRLGASGPR